jgi:hypothetical protein
MVMTSNPLVLSITDEDVEKYMEEHEILACKGEPQELGGMVTSVAKYIIRSIVRSSIDMIPDELELSEITLNLKFVGAPMKCGVEAGIEMKCAIR